MISSSQIYIIILIHVSIYCFLTTSSFSFIYSPKAKKMKFCLDAFAGCC